MILLMKHMFPHQGRNRAILAAAALVFIGTSALARTQTPVGEGQFLRSMIPHHSNAILMCERSAITDPQIKLCGYIVESQRREIGGADAAARQIVVSFRAVASLAEALGELLPMAAAVDLRFLAVRVDLLNALVTAPRRRSPTARRPR